MEFEFAGLEDLINLFNRLSNLEDILTNILTRLCEIGENVIAQTHGHHARVWSEQTADGYSIIAEGQDILFIEFGTGDMAGAMGFLYDQVPISVEPGSWSRAHGGEYWRTGGFGRGVWHFGGQEYHYTPPHPAFYYAYQAMVQALPQIVHEELNR